MAGTILDQTLFTLHPPKICFYLQLSNSLSPVPIYQYLLSPHESGLYSPLKTSMLLNSLSQFSVFLLLDLSAFVQLIIPLSLKYFLWLASRTGHSLDFLLLYWRFVLSLVASFSSSSWPPKLECCLLLRYVFFLSILFPWCFTQFRDFNQLDHSIYTLITTKFYL